MWKASQTSVGCDITLWPVQGLCAALQWNAVYRLCETLTSASTAAPSSPSFAGTSLISQSLINPHYRNGSRACKAQAAWPCRLHYHKSMGKGKESFLHHRVFPNLNASQIRRQKTILDHIFHQATCDLHIAIWRCLQKWDK